MSTVNLAGLRLEIAKLNAEKHRAREAELKTLRAETEMLREQIKLIAHHVNYLRDYMLKQTVINDKIVGILDRRTTP